MTRTIRFHMPNRWCFYGLLLALAAPFAAAQTTALSSQPVDASASAAADYQRYCALCHGENREGYKADHAPSLRSSSLIASGGPAYLYQSITSGRPGTAMAPYGAEYGGPLEREPLINLVRWLIEQSDVDEFLKLPRDPIKGEVALGATLYERECAECHGKDGVGVSAPSLAHPVFLSSVSDAFIRYAIANGRDGTPMAGYADKFSSAELDALTAFLRSRASGWDAPKVALRPPPPPSDYVLNPEGEAPDFKLRAGRFVAADAVRQALADGKRMILLDARPMSDWQRAHIPGAVPMPYYNRPTQILEHLPDDDTWIIAYCACPHAASGRVVDALRANGVSNTAIIDEGIIVWTQQGYPIQAGW
ncbi:MAG: c-type cytochrome [Pseudomonadota bacterium]